MEENNEKLENSDKTPIERLNQDQNKKNPGTLLNFIQRKTLLTLIILIFIFLALSLIVIFISQRNKKKVENNYVEIYNSIKSGNFQKAEDLSRKELQSSPNDINLIKSYVDAVIMEGNRSGNEQQSFNKVNKYFPALLSSNDNNGINLISVGYAFETAGHYNEALEFYNKAISSNPKLALAYFHRGHVLEMTDKKYDSYMDYDKAYELNKNNAMVLMGKGRSSIAKGDIEGAYNFFIKSSEANDASFETKAESLTSAALIKQSQIIYMKQAINLAHQAVEVDPHFSPALGVYGYLLSMNGNPHDGVYYLDLATNENPRIAKNYWQIGVVMNSIKKYETAIDYLKKAIEKVPNDNTLVGYSTKKRTMGLIYYDLAKTYFQANASPSNVLLAVKYATTSDPSLKDIIRTNEIKYKFFRTLGNQKEFLDLLK